ncbi:MAG: aminotransferase class III-fold pyridoxal phosphate-dependent enzyme [Gammaproteobacteria bacterium]
MSATVALSPGFSASRIKAFVKKNYNLQISKVTELGGYIDQNFLLECDTGDKFVCKVHDGREQRAVLDFQNRTMQHLSAKLHTPAFPQIIKSNSGEEITEISSETGQQCLVRVLIYLEGTLLKDVKKFSPALLGNVGKTMGEMDMALQGFYHAAANRPDIPWDLKNTPQIRHITRYIENTHQRRLAEYFFLQYDNVVSPVLVNLRKSVVHNDIHRYSILVNGEKEISGIIDFGDAVYTHTVTNIAISMSDLLVQSENLVPDAAEILGAYHRVFPLTEDEISILYYLICTRLSIYGAMSAWSAKTKPSNAHTQIKTKEVWMLLEKLLAINPGYAEDALRKACDFPVLQDKLRKQADSNLKKRKKYFPGSLYTHYTVPISITAGALQYLYDDSGKTYLDCVNNVCQWGHCHPRIVRAGQKQMADLNTNSRYLYSQMADYAERLASIFPDPLNVCFFVNSGSEANDLAVRLARTYTGQNDIVVIDAAYHGNSTLCTEISPDRVDRKGGPRLPDYVHKTTLPDTFRGEYKCHDREAGKKYATHVVAIIEELGKKDLSPAAFIAESLIGTGGQFVLPDGYLQNVYSHIRDAGGLCIADEVQVGFGRTGNNIWCFESQGVVPDIVTMGKPIGNGHPMAAVITTREIADAFDNGVTYFNTFGGNPVSCAIGLAVLDVLEEENLQENTQLMGRLLMDGLNKLMQKHSIIGDVRGLGLYIGVELVKDRNSLEPASEEAKAIIEKMKARSILLNTNGEHNNIIKIKPPIIINEYDVKRIVNTLDEVLTEYY